MQKQLCATVLLGIREMQDTAQEKWVEKHTYKSLFTVFQHSMPGHILTTHKKSLKSESSLLLPEVNTDQHSVYKANLMLQLFARKNQNVFFLMI